jgi:hypothetical protein
MLSKVFATNLFSEVFISFFFASLQEIKSTMIEKK